MVFVNDYAAILLPPSPIAPVAQPVDGQCDVLAFHPRHDLTLVKLPLVDIACIMDEWIVYERHGTGEGIRYVRVF
jgi:UDPglucose--hexose-1-phosphate uridylyltransferase